MICVNTENQRIVETIDYIKREIEELEREIHDCDYEEDPSGDLVYSPYCYSYEKSMYQAEKKKLGIILELLTRKVPFTMMDW